MSTFLARVRRRRKHELDGHETAELAALADGSLTTERRAALESRVAASPELAELLAEQERAVALTRTAAAEAKAPLALRARIEAERRARRASPSRRPVLIGVAAAVGAVALAVGVLAVVPRTSANSVHAALAGTDLAPGATGEATLTRTTSGWRIELDAPGLPRLAGGRFYQAWLRDSAGVLVPVGTFNEGRRVTLWAGVPPTDFTTLTITRERADGVQSSSGEKVLVGHFGAG